MNSRLLAVFLFLSLILPAPANSTTGEISDAEIVSFVKNSWGWTSFADNMIIANLDGAYDGLPYRDLIKGLIVGLELQQYYGVGQNNEATRVLLTYASTQAVKQALASGGMRGVSAVASAASWPIEWGIARFRTAVANKGYNTEKALYFATRTHNSAEAILNAQDDDLLDADTNGGLVMKKGGWLRPAVASYTTVPSIPGMTAADAFSAFEVEWLCKQSAADLNSDNQTLREAFGSALLPDAPTITTDLLDLTIVDGQSTTFTVVASGTGPFRYVWEMNGSPILVAVGPSLMVAATGEYRVTVYDADNLSVTSRTATVTVLPPGTSVTLTSPGSGATISGTYTVRAAASGATRIEFWIDGVRRYTDTSSPFTCPWNTAFEEDGAHQISAKAYNGTTLLGTTSTRTVTVSNIGASDNDPYEPNNTSSTATPLNASASVQARISSPVDVDWFSVNVTESGNLSLSLAVPSEQDYDLEIYSPNGAFLAGSYQDKGQSESLTIRAAQIGVYHLRVYGYPVGNGSFSVANSYSLSTSFATGQIAIGSQPQPVAIPWGAAATFSVSASSAADPKLSYQWRRDGIPVPGATHSTYTTTDTSMARNGDVYSVTISNTFGSVVSNSVNLGIDDCQSNNWIGMVSNDYNDPQNWNLEHVPNGSEVARIESGNVLVSNGFSAGYIVISGHLIWSGGLINGTVTVAAGGALDLSGTGDKMLGNGTVITNQGTVTVSGAGPLYCCNSTINNQAGGVFDFQTDMTMDHYRGSLGWVYQNWNYAPSVFNNAGRVTKSGGTGTVRFKRTDDSVGYWTFNNSGSVTVQSGTVEMGGFNNDGSAGVAPGTALILANGGTSGGSFDIAPGSALTFSGGTFAFDAGSRLDAAPGATINYNSGAFSFDPGVTVTGTTVNRITGGIALSGTVNLPNFELAGGSIGGTFTQAGHLTWSGGTINGMVTVAEGGTLDIIGTGEKTLTDGAVITNAGTVTVSGAGSVYCCNSTINNLAGGIFDFQTDMTMDHYRGRQNWVYGYWYYVPSVFNNAGRVTKSGGAGTALFKRTDDSSGNWTINNTGTIDIQTGTVVFNSLTNDGAMQVADGAAITFQAGTFAFEAGSRLDAAHGATINYNSGAFSFDPGATVTGTTVNRITGGIALSGTVNLPNFELAGGSIGGAFTLAGHLTWSGGTINGTVTVAEGGTLDIIGTGEKTLTDGAVITNAGTVTVSGAGSVYCCNSTINNLAGGVFDFQTDMTMDHYRGRQNWVYQNWYFVPSVFNNAGRVTKSGGAGTALFKGFDDWGASWTFNNSGNLTIQSGTVEISSRFQAGGFNQTAGMTILDGGGLNLSPALRLTGGVVTGRGTIEGSVINSGGVVKPGNSIGTLTISGNYLQNDSGILDLDIGGNIAGSQYNQLVVTGQASLGGTVRVKLTDGYQPKLGERYVPVLFGSRAEVVTSFNLPIPIDDTALANTYTATQLTIDVIRTAFGEWKIAKFGADTHNIEIAGPFADPNQNCTPNLLEFAFGMEPLLPAQLDRLPQSTISSISGQDYLAIQFMRLVDPNAGLTYRVLETTDLSIWTPVNMQECQVGPSLSNGDGTETVTVRSSLPINGPMSRPSAFLRVEVAEK